MKGWPDLTTEESIQPSRLVTFNGEYLNIAVVFGDGLIGIDWDCPDLFFEFARSNAHAAQTLISQGNKGGTFWFRMEGDYPKRAVRLERPASEATEMDPVGEWRSERCNSVIHGPNLKGGFYSHNGKDPLTIRFDQIVWPKGVHPFNPEVGTERTEKDRIATDDVVSPLVLSNFESVLARTTPRKAGLTDKLLFDYCRGLKNVQLAWGRPLEKHEIVAAFDLWYKTALPHLRKEQSRDRYWMEFTNKFTRAKQPLGRGRLLDRAMTRAQNDPPPIEAAEFTDPKIKQLVSLLYYLQVESGDQAFFISARDCGELLGVNKNVAANWLKALASPIMNIVRVVEKGTTTKSPRLRYNRVIQFGGDAQR